MTWLVACERSGMVRDALLARGIDAVSCDLEPSRRPGPHIQGDAREVIRKRWAGLIAHPVCRRMCNSGVRWLSEREGYYEDMLADADFYNMFRDATHIPKRAVENSVMHRWALHRCGRPTQYVHPWWFGDPFQKMTGWRLFGLPKLVATHRKSDYPDGVQQEVWRMPPGPDREEKRSETKPCTARALAEQWT